MSTSWTAYTQPPAPHPFPHALAGAEWIFVGGMVGIRDDGSLANGVGDQTRQALTNIGRFLNEAGSSWAEVVYIRPYLTDRRHIPEMDSAVREVLPEPRPASGALTITGLADEAFLVEFEAWAYRGAQRVESSSADRRP